MPPRIDVFPTVDDLVQAAVQQFSTSAAAAIEDRGRFVVALSGGHSPQPLYRRLAQQPARGAVPWARTIVLWSDERFVPLEDERSNAGMARRLLLDHVPVASDQVIPMYLEDAGPEEAAVRYESVVRRLPGGSGDAEAVLDLTLLGCGEDGHTASLFPDGAALRDESSLVAAVRASRSDVPRITMTPPLLARSRTVLFLVYGDEKASIVHDVLSGDAGSDRLPARVVADRTRDARWLLDRSAAASLG